MLTEREIQTIRDTVPLLKEKGQTITKIFYKRLFEVHPELKNVFNQTNQKKGTAIISTCYGSTGSSGKH